MAMKKFLGEALLTLMICAAIAAGIAALWDWRFCKGLFWLVFSGVFLVLCALMRAGLTHGFWALWDILRCRAVSQDLQYLGSVERFRALQSRNIYGCRRICSTWALWSASSSCPAFCI